MTLLLIFFVVSIFFSFICSIMEAVLLSITPSYANRQLTENPPIGKKLAEYKKDIDKPLSAILTLNTIAHTIGAIGVGAQAAHAFGTTPFKIPLINLEMSYESLIAGLMTLAILILSEIIPKTLGATYWRGLTPITIKALRVIMFILYPFIWLSKLITKFLKSSDVHSVFSRDDYIAMTSLGQQSGALEHGETKIISNLLGLEKLNVSHIMTPRSVIHAMNEDMTLQDYYSSKKDSPFSRIPIYQEKLDNLVGFVLKEEVLKNIIDGQDKKTLKSLKRPLTIVDRNKSLKEFFTYMQQEGQQLAVVTDQFGSIDGVVTLEDVIETLLGFEIVDELDHVEDLQAYARQKWQERAKKIGLIE